MATMLARIVLDTLFSTGNDLKPFAVYMLDKPTNPEAENWCEIS